MNLLLARMSKLPVELRALIESDDVIYVIDEIGDKFDIPEAWRGELIRATIRVLSGIMQPKDFIPFLVSEYDLSNEEALKLALAINEKIFSAVKPQLASLHNIADNRIARRLKVPHKPRQMQIANETELLPESEAPIAPSADPAPAEQIATIQYVAPAPQLGSQPSPMTTHFAQIPPLPQFVTPGAVNPAMRVPHPVVETPLRSPLTSKLGNMRSGDPYREQP